MRITVQALHDAHMQERFQCRKSFVESSPSNRRPGDLDLCAVTLRLRRRSSWTRPAATFGWRPGAALVTALSGSPPSTWAAWKRASDLHHRLGRMWSRAKGSGETLITLLLIGTLIASIFY